MCYIYSSQFCLLEYCSLETFQPSCAANEVVIMTHAKYGRMKIGRCLERDYGYLGCEANVLHILDGLCSGKEHCRIATSSANMHNVLDCLPQDLRPYLEVDYKCQQG